MPTRCIARVLTSTVVIVMIAVCSLAQARRTSAGLGTPQDPTASLSGTIVNSISQPVAGAKIAITNDDRGLERRTQTNDEGYFYIPFLPPGTYTLLIEMPGFATIRVSGVVLQSSMNSAISLTLQPKGVKEVIDVRATQSDIDASNATIKYSIPSKEIEAFPIIATTSGRSILDSLPLFLPGILPAFSVGIRGEGLVVNGARPLSNSFTIEGGDNNDYEYNRASSPFPNPDALQEISVQTNNYKADLGGAAGAVVDATVKPGTNRFHGNLRYFLQDRALGARSFFEQDKYPYRLSSFGGQVGGPVVIPGLYNGRDRTHFFFDVEDNYNYNVQGGIYAPATLSLAQRAGDFSKLPLGDPSNPYSIHQPVDPQTRSPFPGGIIPANRFDPIARYYLNNLFPLPDLGLDSYLAHLLNRVWNKQYTGRIDQVLGHRDSLTVVLLANLNDYLSASSGANVSQQYDQITNSLNLVAHETHSFSAISVNQVTATYVRFPERTRVDAPGIGVPPGQAGFTGIRPQDPTVVALPKVALGNVVQVGNSIVFGDLEAGTSPGGESAKTTLALKDDLIHATGRHTVKAGVGTRLFIHDSSGDNFFGYPRNGVFVFSNYNSNGTGNSVADFLLGLPASYEQSIGATQHARQPSYSLYLMDDWRLRPGLTLNLGVRYELTFPVTDEQNQAMVFRPGAHSSRFSNAPDGVLFPGDPDPILGTVPRAGYRTSWTDFAPRFGVAYSPRPSRGLLHTLLGSDSSAIRAGFGVFYSPTYGFDSSKPSMTAPFSENLIFGVGKHGSFADPFGRQPNPFPVSPGQVVFDRNASIYTFDPRFRTAYTYQYNLSIQRELPESILLELSYVGSNSFRLDREFDDNPYAVKAPIDYTGSGRIYPQLSSIYVQKSDGRAHYDSFQARVSRKFRAGLMLDFSYAYSKSLDNSSAPSFNDPLTFIYSNDRAGFSIPYTWARSEFDRRQNFVAFYAYDLPAFHGKGVAGLLLNRWQIGGITQLRSGMPMDIQGFSGNGRPDVIGPFHRFDPRHVRTFVVDGTPVTGNFLFDPTVFRDVDPNSHLGIGNLGRNVFDGPGLNLTSISVAKRNQIHETQQLELRADVTNVFNHANFDPRAVGLNTGATSNSPIGSVLGQVQYALPGRGIQLSVRYRF